MGFGPQVALTAPCKPELLLCIFEEATFDNPKIVALNNAIAFSLEPSAWLKFFMCKRIF